MTHRHHAMHRGCNGSGWAGAAAAAVIVLALASPARAQQVDTVPQKLAPVVTITRDTARSPLVVPFAVSSSEPDSMRPGQRHIGLDETLLLLPGVTVANRNNPSQDPRISIRGFGSRSAFGVRSVKVLRDGMPLTMPDGQTPVDYLDLESVGQVEVFRGSAAALYGNASGGVIDLRSAAPPLAPFALQARGWGGSYGFQRWTASFGGTTLPVRYEGDVNYTQQDGYRAYSHQRVTSGYGRAAFSAGTTNLAVQLLAFDEPLAENPGALTQAQIDSAPQMADPLSVIKHARKTVRQYQAGVRASHPLGAGSLEANVYGGTRDLYNPLTFAVVDVKRVSGGGGLRVMLPARALGLAHQFTVGVDLQRQNDHRTNFANCNGGGSAANCPTPGAEEGVLTLDQNEIVSSVGPYVRDELVFGGRYHVDVGVRADVVRFEVKDHLITSTNPDDSGNRTMHAVSPMFGFLARLTPVHSVYADVSTAFETPTTTELGTHPDGSAGLNPDLSPQKSTTYEVGLKGLIASRVMYDFAVFDTEVSDELIPFEVPGGSGRTYYRNAGRTRRQGAEIGVNTIVGPLEVGATYSLSHFRFRDYVVDSVSYAGNTIPGIPASQFQIAATWRHESFFATAEGIAQTRMFVNDANDAAASGYRIVNLRAGATSLFGNPSVAPYIGVQNLFDRHYVGSVAINASRGKYFEPAPARTIYAGLTLGVGR